MELPQPPQPLDVERLIDASRPQAGLSTIWWVGGIVLVVTLLTSMAGHSGGGGREVVGVLLALSMLLLIGAASATSVYWARQLRNDQQQVERIGELIQLGQWPDAALGLEAFLSRPSRLPQLRSRALVYLSSVLGRLRRYDAVLAVLNHLIEDPTMDPADQLTVRVGRVMAMLHEDHLFDADRAIIELRRSAAGPSAALALVEMYRDVKTGHPAEAIANFDAKRDLMREQLGIRVADAWGLAARAYDLLGRGGEAKAAFTNATLLSPVAELFRRYPELEKLAPGYMPAPAPPEAV